MNEKLKEILYGGLPSTENAIEESIRGIFHTYRSTVRCLMEKLDRHHVQKESREKFNDYILDAQLVLQEIYKRTYEQVKYDFECIEAVDEFLYDMKYEIIHLLRPILQYISGSLDDPWDLTASDLKWENFYHVTNINLPAYGTLYKDIHCHVRAHFRNVRTQETKMYYFQIDASRGNYMAFFKTDLIAVMLMEKPQSPRVGDSLQTVLSNPDVVSTEDHETAYPIRVLNQTGIYGFDDHYNRICTKFEYYKEFLTADIREAFYKHAYEAHRMLMLFTDAMTRSRFYNPIPLLKELLIMQYMIEYEKDISDDLRVITHAYKDEDDTLRTCVLIQYKDGRYFGHPESAETAESAPTNNEVMYIENLYGQKIFDRLRMYMTSVIEFIYAEVNREIKIPKTIEAQMVLGQINERDGFKEFLDEKLKYL